MAIGPLLWRYEGKSYWLLFLSESRGFSTISFQTVTQNHFLTPNILGMDSLYIFVQTVLFFLLGGAQALGQVSLGSF